MVNPALDPALSRRVPGISKIVLFFRALFLLPSAAKILFVHISMLLKRDISTL